MGTGTVLDLLTHTNTIPIAGNPRVSATCSHTQHRRCVCHSSTVSSLLSPLPPAPTISHPASSPAPSLALPSRLCHLKMALTHAITHPMPSHMHHLPCH